MARIVVSNGHLLDPAAGVDKTTDIFIADGKIAAIGKKPAGFSADRTLDAKNYLVIPGIVDLCARLREPGLEHKATIKSECMAAARAGITTLCCPPDTDPVIDEPAVVELINHKAHHAGFSKVLTLGALTTELAGERLSEMWALKVAGCVGVSNAKQPVDSTLVQKRAYAYACNCGFTVFVEPNDHWLSSNGYAHEGSVATRLGLNAIPASAETVALARALELVKETGVRAHFGRLSTALGVEMIRRAKNEHIDITADVSAHQLHLTELDVSSLNSNCRVLPPLRTQRDMEALRQGIADGTIDAICSDHQPHEPDAKLVPFASAAPGISALETLLPLTLRLVQEQVLPLETALRALTHSPATILGMSETGLVKGAVADLCVIDMDCDWQLQLTDIHSRGKNTPFTGWNFQGKAKHTIINGRLITD